MVVKYLINAANHPAGGRLSEGCTLR